MPLCWSHAEYVSLVRSAHDGICFDRVEPAFQRYVLNPVASQHEIWSFRHAAECLRAKSCASSLPQTRRSWSANA
jgi:glucoamylase